MTNDNHNFGAVIHNDNDGDNERRFPFRLATPQSFTCSFVPIFVGFHGYI